MQALQSDELSNTKVVAKALMNVKQALRLNGETVGNIIGADASTVSRIGKHLDMAHNKSYEAALLLVRVYRSLYAMVGGNQDAMLHWLNTDNLDFNSQPPLTVMQSWVGLVDVVQYLDAMRGNA